MRILGILTSGIVSVAIGLIVFVLLSHLLFGNAWLPIAGGLWFLNDPSSAPLTTRIAIAILVGFIAAYALVFLGLMRGLKWVFSAPAFIAIFVIVTWGTLSIELESSRVKALLMFRADKSVQHTVFWSYRQAMKSFKIEPHAATMKDCQIYIWSYKQMAFQEIGPNTAKNITPQKWRELCPPVVEKMTAL